MSARKLTFADAQEIRRRYAEGGVSQRGLAAEYGVSQGAVCFILDGTAYSPDRLCAHCGEPGDFAGGAAKLCEVCVASGLRHCGLCGVVGDAAGFTKSGTEHAECQRMACAARAAVLRSRSPEELAAARAAVAEKRCSTCRKTKSSGCFSTDPGTLDGYHSRCLECIAASKRTPRARKVRNARLRERRATDPVYAAKTRQDNIRGRQRRRVGTKAARVSDENRHASIDSRSPADIPCEIHESHVIPHDMIVRSAVALREAGFEDEAQTLLDLEIEGLNFRHEDGPTNNARKDKIVDDDEWAFTRDERIHSWEIMAFMLAQPVADALGAEPVFPKLTGEHVDGVGRVHPVMPEDGEYVFDCPLSPLEIATAAGLASVRRILQNTRDNSATPVIHSKQPTGAHPCETSPLPSPRC